VAYYALNFTFYPPSCQDRPSSVNTSVFLPLNFSPLSRIFLPLSFPPLSRRSSSNSATFSSAPNWALLSQDPLSALLSSYIVSSQKNTTSSNHSTTNIIKTPLLIMVNTICLHEGCKRKLMKHGNGSCHLHGVRRKCSFPQCSNNARRAGMCVQHGSIKKKCNENGCTNNAIRKGVCINHGAKHYCKHEIYIALDYQISCSVSAWFCRLMEGTAHQRDISPANFVGAICLYTTVEGVQTPCIGMTWMWDAV